MGCDTLIVDTAGRLHIDEELMAEMERLKKLLNPQEILFVADAMTGQDAVNSAQDFHSRLGLTGVVLTKMDGDARGGAALSIRHVTGQPIKFIGVGEKPDAFEPFHPDRIVGRILGMGDMLSLIEKAESTLDRKKSEELAKKALLGDGFSLEDFRDQLRQIKKLGSMESILKMLPSVGPFAGMQQAAGQVDEKQFVRLEAIINSMTPQERRNHEIISGSRRKRIAAGSGTSVQDVNQLLRQYAQMAKMFKQVGRMGMAKSMMRGGLGAWAWAASSGSDGRATLNETALQDQLDEITANTRQPGAGRAPGRRRARRRGAVRLRHRRKNSARRRDGSRVYAATMPPAGWCARPTCSPSGRWSSSSFAAAGAPTASPSSRPGATSTRSLREAGALLVAIGPQTARQSDFMVGQHGLPFPVLCRSRLRRRRAVRPRLHHPRIPPRLLPLDPGQHPLRERRATLAAAPSRPPTSSARTGRVVYAEAHADFRVRPEPEEALAVALDAVGK